MFSHSVLVAAVTAAAAFVALPACVSPVAASAPKATPAPAPVELRDGAWGTFNSKRFQLAVPLPDGQTWRIDDRSSEWLDASHPSNASFRARVWFEHDLVTRAACEKKLRFWVPALPAPAGEDLLDERDLADFPAPGFTSHLVVGLATPPGADSAAVTGVALAIGASDHKCVVLMFTSAGRGTSSAAALAARLELGTRIIEGTRLRTEPSPGRQPFESPAR